LPPPHPLVCRPHVCCVRLPVFVRLFAYITHTHTHTHTDTSAISFIIPLIHTHLCFPYHTHPTHTGEEVVDLFNETPATQGQFLEGAFKVCSRMHTHARTWRTQGCITPPIRKQTRPNTSVFVSLPAASRSLIASVTRPDHPPPFFQFSGKLIGDSRADISTKNRPLAKITVKECGVL